MDRFARLEAQRFRHNASEHVYPALGYVALDATPQQESDESVKRYDEYRPEYYGYISHIIIDTTRQTTTKASQRGAFGMCYYGEKPVDSVQDWSDLQRAAFITLSQDADSLYFQNHEKPVVLTQLEALMDKLSYLVDGAYQNPRQAVQAGIETATTALVQLAHSMSLSLKQNQPEYDATMRANIIQNSSRIFVETAMLNLFQLHALNFSTTPVMQREFVLVHDQLSPEYGSINQRPVLPALAASIGTNTQPEHSLVGDIDYPFSHIGCPITLEPKAVTALWQWGVAAAQKADLL